VRDDVPEGVDTEKVGLLQSMLAGTRNRRIAANVLAALLARSGALALLLYSTRLMLLALGPADMGRWLVVLGVLQWVTLFDLGIGYGARNEIARRMAAGDEEGAGKVVATAYWYFTMIAAGLGVVAMMLQATPLRAWVNQHAFAGSDLGPVVALSLGAILVNFVVGFIQQVYAAMEKAAVISLYSLLVNLIMVVALLVASPTHFAGIGYVACAYAFAMVAPNVWFSWRLFRRNPSLRPAWKKIDHGLRARIFGVGLPLFVVQLCALVIFSTDRLLVSIAVGPRAVVPYDAAFKLFTIITLANSLLTTTYLSSFTHASEKNDWAWIRRSVRLLQLVMVPVAMVSVLAAILAPSIIRLWLGPAAVGSGALFAGFAVYTVLSCWSDIHGAFLNGVGNVHVHMYSVIVPAIINLPLSLYFASRLGLAEAGIVWGGVASLLVFGVTGPWQTARIIRRGLAAS
jgi:O-antigen/teichoic acid export membrane protein